jgi:hypothetical protein
MDIIIQKNWEKFDEINNIDDFLKSVDYGREKHYFEYDGIIFISDKKIIDINRETLEPIYE